MKMEFLSRSSISNKNSNSNIETAFYSLIGSFFLPDNFIDDF